MARRSDRQESGEGGPFSHERTPSPLLRLAVDTADFRELTNTAVDLVVLYLTYEEIKYSGDFYESPIGRSITEKMPILFAQVSAHGIDLYAPLKPADVPFTESVFQNVLSAAEYKALLGYLNSPLGQSAQRKTTQMVNDPKFNEFVVQLARKLST